MDLVSLIKAISRWQQLDFKVSHFFSKATLLKSNFEFRFPFCKTTLTTLPVDVKRKQSWPESRCVPQIPRTPWSNCVPSY
eukprot:6466642-Amphidinium_carterae.1